MCRAGGHQQVSHELVVAQIIQELRPQPVLQAGLPVKPVHGAAARHHHVGQVVAR